MKNIIRKQAVLKILSHVMIVGILFFVVFGIKYSTIPPITDEDTYKAVGTIVDIGEIKKISSGRNSSYGFLIYTETDSYVHIAGARRDVLNIANELNDCKEELTFTIFEHEASLFESKGFGVSRIKRVVDLRSDTQIFLNLDSLNTTRNAFRKTIVILCVVIIVGVVVFDLWGYWDALKSNRKKGNKKTRRAKAKIEIEKEKEKTKKKEMHKEKLKAIKAQLFKK